MATKINIVLLQLGSPKSPKVSDVREYLKEFLGDPRVVDMNPRAWKLILNLFILPFRPKRSAKAYSRIWDGKEFPLVSITNDLTTKISEHIGSEDLFVKNAFLLSYPRAKDLVDDWEKVSANFKRKDEGRWLFVPLFPQSSESTTLAAFDALGSELKDRTNAPNFEFLTNYHKSKAFIDNSVRLIEKTLEDKKPDQLILSFHGLPKQRILEKKDIYYQHCFETFKLLTDKIQDIPKNKIHFCFQSRFGRDEWLDPDAAQYAKELVQGGNKKIAVYCPSFLIDCLETVDEIGHELKEDLKADGGEVSLIPCLNTDESWIKDFGNLLKVEATGSLKEKEELFYDLPEEVYEEMPEQKYITPPLTKKAKSSLRIMFLTLFLDLVGFSIIFPLFPQLAKHYLLVDGDNFFLNLIFDSVAALTQVGNVSDKVSGIVLFGGALGALYSLLQFVAAPIWGSISDRIGRRPVLLVSVFGLALSYLLWFFSGSFTLLILARLIGGIMGGNISTATAVVADVTDTKNRSKGMASIGIAFAFGFILGPALGGILSLVDLTQFYPNLSQYGVNPFSVPALLAFVLSTFNFIWIYRHFKETLPEEKRGKGEVNRTMNPFKLIRPLPFKGVNQTNLGNFLFLLAFSGMEFTLTFLALDRLSYSSLDNAYLFIFIGFVIAFVQGGYVRRKAADVGERKMAMRGLIITLPGLLIIGFAKSSLILYFGLFFLAVGSSMATPCLTSLVSLYTPPEKQGLSIGIFRSLGALSRVIGPILAAIVYWHQGSHMPYVAGAIFLLIPIIMVSMLPDPDLSLES